MGNFSVIVLDFETTGLSPRHGDRPIEVGAVRIDDCRIVDRFQSLMNPGFPVSSFITALTGISSAMLSTAPSCEKVMADLADFVGPLPVVAHNARFDRMFLESEFAELGLPLDNTVVCSMLIARRVFPEARNHRLATLVDHCGLIHDGTYHRALADAELTARIWIAMIHCLKESHGIRKVSLELMQQLSAIPKSRISQLLAKTAGQEPPPALF